MHSRPISVRFGMHPGSGSNHLRFGTDELNAEASTKIDGHLWPGRGGAGSAGIPITARRLEPRSACT